MRVLPQSVNPRHVVNDHLFIHDIIAVDKRNSSSPQDSGASEQLGWECQLTGHFRHENVFALYRQNSGSCFRYAHACRLLRTIF